MLRNRDVPSITRTVFSLFSLRFVLSFNESCLICFGSTTQLHSIHLRARSLYFIDQFTIQNALFKKNVFKIMLYKPANASISYQFDCYRHQSHCSIVHISLIGLTTIQLSKIRPRNEIIKHHRVCNSLCLKTNIVVLKKRIFKITHFCPSSFSNTVYP